MKLSLYQSPVVKRWGQTDIDTFYRVDPPFVPTDICHPGEESHVFRQYHTSFADETIETAPAVTHVGPTDPRAEGKQAAASACPRQGWHQ